jgi:hypothetical protein
VDPAAAGANYRYAVAAYTAAGAESELGEVVQVAVGAAPLWKMYLPFVGR